MAGIVNCYQDYAPYSVAKEGKPDGVGLTKPAVPG